MVIYKADIDYSKKLKDFYHRAAMEKIRLKYDKIYKEIEEKMKNHIPNCISPIVDKTQYDIDGEIFPLKANDETWEQYLERID